MTSSAPTVASHALDPFESDLRRITGVVSVGFTGSLADLRAHLTLGHDADLAHVQRAAEELGRHHLEGAVTFVVALSGEALARNASTPATEMVRSSVRPALSRVSLREDGSVELELARGGRSVTATAPDERPASVAAATLAALSDLGTAVPWVVHAATMLADGFPGAVVVSLGGSHGERMGVSRGNTAADAAAKATLHALNRYLEGVSTPLSQG